MIDLGILALAGLAAFFMLLRGDPHWTHPVFAAAAALVIIPTATTLMFQMFLPETPPLFESKQGEFLPHPWPAGSLQEVLERNYEEIHSTLEAIKSAHFLSASAAFTAAYTNTVISILISLVPGGQLVTVVKWAIGVQRLDPIMNIAFTVNNAATALYMIYHFMEFVAGAAVKLAVPLLMFSLVAMIFGPTRALGGVMYFFALVMITLSTIGHVLSPTAILTATWLGEFAKWTNATATNATGTAPTPLLVVEGTPHTLYLARYNNFFILPNASEIAADMGKIVNFTMPKEAVELVYKYADRYGFFEKAAFNDTDWVTAAVNSITPVAYGTKNWTAYAVNTWLDFPAPAPVEGGCIEHEGFYEFLGMLPEDRQRWVINMTREICKLHEKMGYRSYHLRIDVPDHWRFLFTMINYTAVDRWKVLDKGFVPAWNGVWGWLQPPDEERCFDALGREALCGMLNTTIRVGFYNFSIWGRKNVVNPVTGAARSVFNITLLNSSAPVFSRSIDLYTWKETCEWCCEWECGNGTCWCTRWCSSTRDTWERAEVDKRLGVGEVKYNKTIYKRPWIPGEPQNHTGGVSIVTRTWDVSIWLEYGPWIGDGTPPADASCRIHSRRVYMVLAFYKTQQGAMRTVYGFWWLRSGVLQHAQHGEPLPDILANYTDTDGVRVIHYLEGVEHQYYCSAETPQASTPSWHAVPDAERNLTKLLREDYFNLIIYRNFSKAYFAQVNLTALREGVQNFTYARLAVESIEQYLAALEKTPAAVPMYHTSNSYQAGNFLLTCVMYDWRGAAKAHAELRLTPGEEWWVAAYPMGDSRVARHLMAKADVYREMLRNPPPPPPAELAGFVSWGIPWNNRSLPYTPYYSVGMPPVDNATGVPLWDVGRLFTDVVKSLAGLVNHFFVTLFVSIFVVVAVFEFLAAIFEFPTPLGALRSFTMNVILEWTYWLPFRLFVRARWFVRIWRVVKMPFMRFAVKTAARAHSFFAARVPGLRYIRHPDLKAYYEYVKRKRDLVIKDPAEAERERIRKVFVEDALERIRRAVEEREDVEWYRRILERREEEMRRRVEMAKRLWRTLKAHDVVQAARELSPQLDYKLQQWVEMVRHSWSYYFFWWRLDKISPLERSLLRINPAVVERELARGKISKEDAQALLNLAEAVRAHVAELRYNLTRLHEVSHYVRLTEEEWEKARRIMTEAVKRGHLHFERFIQEFTRRYEALRSPDDAAREEALAKVVEHLEKAVEAYSQVDKAPRARVISAINEAFQRLAAASPPLPRALEDVVKHLAGLEYELAINALKGAFELLKTHYQVAPTPLDTRRVAAEYVKWKIAEEIPTLKLASLARGIILGVRGVEEGEIALKTWSTRRRLSSSLHEAPWETVVGKASLLKEQRLAVKEVVKIKPDVVLLADYAQYLTGFKVEREALETLRKAVEYGRVMRQLERVEELRLPPSAVEKLRERAERLKQEVLRETWSIYRQFGEEWFFTRDLLEGRRVVKREAPEVRETMKVFEEALREAFKAPLEERARTFNEIFKTRVEEIARFFQERGGVEEVGKIRRFASEVLKAVEKINWGAVEEIRGIKPDLERLQTLLQIHTALSDVELWRRVRLAIAVRKLGEAVKAAAEAEEELRQIKTPELRVDASVRRQVEDLLSRFKELEDRAKAVERRLTPELREALELSRGGEYEKAFSVVEAAERKITERLAQLRDVEPLVEILGKIGVDAARLAEREYREQVVKDVEKMLEVFKGNFSKVDEKTAKVAEALLGDVSLFGVLARVWGEAPEVYPVFVKAFEEAFKAEDRPAAFRRIFGEGVERLIKAFEERGLRREVEELRNKAEHVLKTAEEIRWGDELPAKLSKAAEELAAALRDEKLAEQIGEYAALTTLLAAVRELRDVVEARRRLEEEAKPLLARLPVGVEEGLKQLEEAVRRVELAEARERALREVETAAKRLEKVAEELPPKIVEKLALREIINAAKEGRYGEALEKLGRAEKVLASAELDKFAEEVMKISRELGLDVVAKAFEEGRSRQKAIKAVEGELDKLYGLAKLVEFFEKPSIKNLGGLRAEGRGLAKFLLTLSEISALYWRSRELFRNPLYDDVKHLIDRHWIKALIRAPMYSYVVDKLGPELLGPVYARWNRIFFEYRSHLGAAYEHAETGVLATGAPAMERFSYASQIMKWLGDFSQEAVIRGLRAYYKGEGRPFRTLSELTIIGAEVQLLSHAAEFLTAKASQMLGEVNLAKMTGNIDEKLEAEAAGLKLLAALLRAKAAYMEVRLAQKYLKDVERRVEAELRSLDRVERFVSAEALEEVAKAREKALAALNRAREIVENIVTDAGARYRAHLDEAAKLVEQYGASTRELGFKLFGLTARAFSGSPREVVEKMVKYVDVRRLASWAGAFDLPRELGALAVRIIDAERLYHRFEKLLAERGRPAEPGFHFGEGAAQFFETPPPPPSKPRPRAEEAVPKAVKELYVAYYNKLKTAAERAALYLALVKGDARHSKGLLERARQLLQRAVKGRDVKALE